MHVHDGGVDRAGEGGSSGTTDRPNSGYVCDGLGETRAIDYPAGVR